MTTQTIGKTDKSLSCKVHVRKIMSGATLPALSEIFACLDGASILGGNISKTDGDRFSYWAAEPVEIFEFHSGQNEPLEKLSAVLGKYKLDKDSDILPKGMFFGGWVGYFAYELGRYIEKLPDTTIDDLEMPLIRLCFYDKVIAYDHGSDIFRLIALEVPGEIRSVEEKLSDLEKLLARAKKMDVRGAYSCDLEGIDFSQLSCNMDKEYYLKAVEKIKRYIYDGDVYQVNFSQRFECDYRAGPIELFHWQNQFNPSPYAAYIEAGYFQIVSASPEMFITITEGLLSTKPIKGTRPRTGNKKTDEKNFYELAASEKEQAELNMIVDLERNDVARICVPGSRFVIQPRTVETYPTVFHAVATIQGQLRNDIDFCDILKAVFPGGSITGAPKVASMEIIDETEPTARGVYTGSIGFIGIDGSVCLNIAIRTIIITGQKAFAQTGGGIVADSDGKAEWDETLTKARALLAGIKSVQSEKNKNESILKR